MPIPEPGLYRPSRLTRKEKETHMRALYGVEMTESLSHEEIERMRHIIAQHDSGQAPVKTIDLNNPPRETYKFKAFPKIVYDLVRSAPGNIVNRTVRSHEELETAIEDGWREEAPSFGNWEEERLSPALAAEANRVQGQIDEENRKRPGRPRKEVAVA